MINKLHNEDCLLTMSKMPNNYLDLVIVSFPYGSLRDYNGYSFEFEKIAMEISRCLKDGGIFISVIGYPVVNKSKSLEPMKQAIYLVEECDLLLHDHLIYEKSSFSFPDASRYGNIWESIYIFSKGKPKTFNPIIDREVKYQQSRGKATQRQKDGSMNDTGRGIIKYNKLGKRNNIWRYSTGFGNSTRDKIAYKHPAIAPEKLMQDLIYSFSNENDLVYCPMAGSGTEIKGCIKLKRNWIASEISKDYCENIIKPRLEIA